MGFDAPVEKWIDFDHDEFMYCPDRLSTVNNPMIVMTQYHPLGALAAKRIIEHVENRTYFDDPWSITGPGVYRDVANGTGMITTYNTRCWTKYWTPGKAMLDAYLLSEDDNIYNLTQ